MIVIRFLQVVILLFLVAGCFGPSVEYVQMDPATVGELRGQVPLYPESVVQGRAYTIIQPLSGISCKNMLWAPSPTRNEATDQLRAQAARLDGNGVLNVTCEAPSGPSLLTNCWSSLTCHGAAIKVPR